MDRDYWMNAEEARQYGMVDQILKKVKNLCKNPERVSLGDVETQKKRKMKNEMKKQMVEKIYRENENRTDKGIDEMVITEALGVATEECDTHDGSGCRGFRSSCSTWLWPHNEAEHRQRCEFQKKFVTLHT